MASPFYTRKKSLSFRKDSEVGRAVSATAEHITVRTYVVVPHKQLASEGFEVEVISEIAHRPFIVVAFVDDVTSRSPHCTTGYERCTRRAHNEFRPRLAA